MDREVVKWIALVCLCLTMLISVPILVINLTEGPPGPPPCAKSGIRVIFQKAGNTGDPPVICNNGASYWP